MADRDQLARLSKPFPDRYVESKPGSGYSADYVAHPVISQRLLEVLGPYETSVVEVLRGQLGDEPNAIVGVVLRLTVTIDGQRVSTEDIGDVGDNAEDQHDGQRAKDARSDALKRCAKDIGVGLHLWAQDKYYLHNALTAGDTPDGSDTDEEPEPPPDDLASRAAAHASDTPRDDGGGSGPPQCTACGEPIVGPVTKVDEGRYRHRDGCPNE